jgi:hypothetical protein
VARKMDDRIRTSDADRDRVAARLRDHFAEGRLTRDELEERIAATLNARTFGDLRQVLTDLPEPTAGGPGLTDLADAAGMAGSANRAGATGWAGPAGWPGATGRAGAAAMAGSAGRARPAGMAALAGRPLLGRARSYPAFRRRPRLFPLVALGLIVLVLLPGTGAAAILLKLAAIAFGFMLLACVFALFMVARFVHHARRQWQSGQLHHAWNWPDAHDWQHWGRR